MSKTDEHIKRVAAAIEDWLRPDNQSLKRAIDLTVENNLFSFQDIKHQILHLKESLTEENLKKWVELNSVDVPFTSDKTVLCLHAGNLPLVGLQDLLAVSLTGLNYSGKLSRKDPFLLPTLIEKLNEHDVKGEREVSTKLLKFRHIKADAVLFAGSEKSEREVIQSLEEYNIANSSTPRLMRTAHYSIAYITDNQKETMENLTEAVFRYGGTGCRSVGIVIAPFSLNSQKCHFTDYVESFWLKHPQHKKPNHDLFYRYATNKAVGIEQAWLDDFLIEETDKRPDDKFILHWIKGDANTLRKVVNKYRNGLQTVYTQSGHLPDTINDKVNIDVDKLRSAQKPDIWWRPDGIDSIQWLSDRLSRVNQN